MPRQQHRHSSALSNNDLANGMRTGSLAVAQKLQLELLKSGEDVEDQSPGRARGVDALVQRPQTDSASHQGIHGGQKLVQANHLRGQAISGIERIGCGRFLEHPLAPGSIEGVDLTIGGLQIGRDTWGSVILTGLGHPSVPHIFQGR
jgi:hypothetical protein